MAKNIEVGKSYMIYGKIGDMQRFKPLAGTMFVDSLMHAEWFQISSEECRRKMVELLASLNTQGVFEARTKK